MIIASYLLRGKPEKDPFRPDGTLPLAELALVNVSGGAGEHARDVQVLIQAIPDGRKRAPNN
jgi:hypothetical protein